MITGSPSIEQARKSLLNMMQKHNSKLITFVGKVAAVDEGAGTCDVEPIDGNPIFYDVRLVPSVDNITDGVVSIPLVGSFVICGRLENENDVFIMVAGEITKFIVKCSDSGKIELNGNGFSMVKGETLQTQLDQLKTDFNNHLIAYNIHVHTGGTISGSTGVPAVIEDPSAVDFSKILNDEVKHG